MHMIVATILWGNFVIINRNPMTTREELRIKIQLLFQATREGLHIKIQLLFQAIRKGFDLRIQGLILSLPRKTLLWSEVLPYLGFQIKESALKMMKRILFMFQREGTVTSVKQRSLALLGLFCYGSRSRCCSIT